MSQERYTWIGDDCPPQYKRVGSIDVADPADISWANDRGYRIGSIYDGKSYSVAEPCAADIYEEREDLTDITEGLTGREHNPWLCHVTPKEVYATSNRILDLIQESDPLGDRITQHELRIFSQAFADLGNSQALFRFQHGLDQETPKDCPVCGGDCASANPPMINCPMKAEREVLR